MAFRGWFALNQVEIANSSRVVAHLGHVVPTDDYGIFGTTLPDDCGLLPVLQEGSYGGSVADSAATSDSGGWEWSGLFEVPADAVMVSKGLYRPMNGARRFGPGLYEVGDCWGPANICRDCNLNVLFDDTWDGLADFLNDGEYRPEVAPWYTTQLPESAEFGGVWVMDVEGLDTTPIERKITETVANGGVASPHRDTTRTVHFDALLVACTNAGLQYGLNWLTNRLRETNTSTETRLRYLTAHPGHSGVDPDELVRDLHSVVMTKAPEVKEQFVTGSGANKQANIYRVSWEMAALNPYSYLPPVPITVDWDRITRQPINWIHAADCHKPDPCLKMPVMYSTECVPEEILTVTTPPPVCGGCLPVSGIDKYVFTLPTQNYVFRSRETAVSMVITNTGEESLSLQAFFRVCNTDIRCDDNLFPLQVSGLPSGAELHLDGITGRYWAYYDERVRRPIGVVGTPNGAPWRPPLIDREQCLNFIVQAAAGAEFTVSMTMADREP